MMQVIHASKGFKIACGKYIHGIDVVSVGSALQITCKLCLSDPEIKEEIRKVKKELGGERV